MCEWEYILRGRRGRFSVREVMGIYNLVWWASRWAAVCAIPGGGGVLVRRFGCVECLSRRFCWLFLGWIE
jgi:hypothetical protein